MLEDEKHDQTQEIIQNIIALSKLLIRIEGNDRNLIPFLNWLIAPNNDIDSINKKEGAVAMLYNVYRSKIKHA